MTVRQVFYQAVTRGVVDKTEGEYKGTVCRLLAEMRRNGDIPFHWIADNTRWMRKPDTHSCLRSMLQSSQRLYRRDLWRDQDDYVEVWLEKEALAGVLVEVTEEWDVPLMVTRGYPSLSFVNSAAEAIRHQQRPTHLYYFGDHDPSGVDIDRFVHQSIAEFCPDAELTFTRVAVTESQIENFNLPTRPTKKSDSRSRNFKGESVEVDAIPPAVLKDICEKCITHHIDSAALERTRVVEQAERKTLGRVIETLGAA